MTVNELYKHLDTRISRSLSCEWDNDGLMCCPDGEREVKKALVCLDVTEDVTSFAVKIAIRIIIISLTSEKIRSFQDSVSETILKFSMKV